ncbi:pleckstrin homology domain-containing family G member 7-like [Palaemon carinicauda]|uniref:pleckstrin homology domain-containing family G member 7-like n=1 Tax=Palaemon carinicauda TaxID=392227 RepID=UPI0035B5DE4D
MFRPVGLLLHSQSVPCFGSYENISHLDVPDAGSKKRLVQGRDGGRGGAGYMNLPSPNVAAEDNEPSLFRGEGEASDSDTGEEPGPPASALTRRRALVPPKLLTDTANYDPQERDSPTAINGCADSSVARNKRRSSIVVIPPMQICPGDLLVYSKVLTQRTNLLAGELDGSTQSLAVTDAGDKSGATSTARSFSSSDTYSSLHSNPVGTRKGKNTWSLLRLVSIRQFRGRKGVQHPLPQPSHLSNWRDALFRQGFKVYMEPLKKIQVDGYAMFAEPELLFGNLDELCCVTYAFCKEFINLLEQHQVPGGQLDTTNVLVKLFQKGSKATMLCQAYHRYALNYINALNYLETLRRQLEFCEFEKWCNRDPRCKKLQLTDLLVAPVQHIMKVPLILRDIEGRTEDPQERAVVREIIEAEEHSLRELDDKMKWLKNFERLLEIQRNIVWPPVTELDPKVYIPEFLKGAISRQPCERLIVSPRRQIILEGSLHMLDNNKPQEMYVILFDDMLLVTRRKKGLHKKKSSLTENWPSSCSRGSSAGESALRYIVYKQPLSLDRFFIHDVTPHESAASKLEAAFVLVNLNRFQQIVAVYTFQAQTEQIKQTWLLKLRDTQDKWKRTLQNTVFRSQRLPSSATTPPKGTHMLREASLQREYP